MLSDPWSRPTLDDLRRLEEHARIRSQPVPVWPGRFPCRIPAELVSRRGNSVSAMTRDMGPTSLTLIHKGSIPLGQACLRLAGEQDGLVYLARVERCEPCIRGFYRSEVSIESEKHSGSWI